MVLSTPASPTPETGDGDDLLLELRAFLASATSNSFGSMAMVHRNADSALHLLRRLPAAKEGKLKNIIFKQDFKTMRAFNFTAEFFKRHLIK